MEERWGDEGRCSQQSLHRSPDRTFISADADSIVVAVMDEELAYETVAVDD